MFDSHAESIAFNDIDRKRKYSSMLSPIENSDVMRRSMKTNIREIRESLGMTQIDLAAAADLPQSTISKVESGGGNPTVETLDKIARALNTPIPRLFSADADPTPLAELVRKFSKLTDDEQAVLLQTADVILSGRN